MKSEAPKPQDFIPGHHNPIRRWLAKRAMPQNFHCVDCGEKFTKKASFDEHVVSHQILDICYQIQESEDVRFECENGDISLQNAWEESEVQSEVEEEKGKENVSPSWTQENSQLQVETPRSVTLTSNSISTPSSCVSSDFREPPAPTQLFAFMGDSDRLCSLCFEKTPLRGIVDHLIEHHEGSVLALRASKAGETITTINPSIMCDFCPEESFAREHDFFLHIWKAHVRNGDELRNVRKPYKMVLDVGIREGTVGVTMLFEARLAAGSYSILKIYNNF